jgi:hypothetical protein
MTESTFELAVEPEMYSPSIDDAGKYADKLPSADAAKHGIRCPCGSQKNKIYRGNAAFSLHVKTEKHKKWIESVNLNRANYYIDNIRLNETIRNQQLIISGMEKELRNKSLTIDYLAMQMSAGKKPVSKDLDLLDF